MLGSIWAYYELGWGGFWFWDPVENISLMPWLSLTALLHCVVTLEKRNILKNWTIILSLITFMLSITGTFLVRSGILNSVHTFANDPTRGIYILIFLFVLIFISFIIFFSFSCILISLDFFQISLGSAKEKFIKMKKNFLKQIPLVNFLEKFYYLKLIFIHY